MQNKHIVSLLRFAAIFLFLGRGWQHLVYNGPYGTLYSSSRFFGGFLSWLTGESHAVLINNPYFTESYNLFNDCLAVVFFLAALGVFFVNKRNSIFKTFVKLGGYALVFTALGYYVEKSLTTGQFFEYSAQMIIPYLLLRAIKFKMKKKFLSVAKMAIAITFICHGLYAVDYYPLPGNFTGMVINFTGWSNDTANLALKIVGILDFIFAVGIFVPKIERYCLYYGLFWGFLTAFARLYLNFDGDFIKMSFNQHTFEFLVRIPHFIIPLLLLRYKKEIYI